MKSRTLITGGIAALALALGAFALLSSPDGSSAAAERTDAPKAPRITVQVGELRRMTLHRYVDGYGVVEPAPATPQRPAAAAAVAAPVSGVVTQVAIAAGERVKRGQLLMELNSSTMTESYAEQEVTRLKRLYAEHNASLKALQSAQAQLALLRVTAPLSGTLVSVNVKPGAAVDASTVLAEVIDVDRLVVRTDIPEADASQLAPGEPLQVLGATPISTTLAYVSPTVSANDGTVMAWGSLPAKSGLRPGQYVHLRVVTKTEPNALAAPSESVIGNIVGGRSVLSIVRGSEAIRVPVEAGLREGGWVAVTGPGLRAGTRVVTAGAYGLPDRTAIQIVDPLSGQAASPLSTDGPNE
jgi:multidrug efflux pump subunit AcrA (membrane-fusion protein)